MESAKGKQSDSRQTACLRMTNENHSWLSGLRMHGKASLLRWQNAAAHSQKEYTWNGTWLQTNECTTFMTQFGDSGAGWNNLPQVTYTRAMT